MAVAVGVGVSNLQPTDDMDSRANPIAATGCEIRRTMTVPAKSVDWLKGFWDSLTPEAYPTPHTPGLDSTGSTPTKLMATKRGEDAHL